MRNKILIAVALALTLGVTCGSVDAATVTKVGKMYKWTDKDGNVHYSDQIPPEAKEYAREKINDQGVSVERTDRAMTPEELAAIEAEEKAKAEAAKVAEERRKADEALLNSYASEEDLTRAFNQRMDLLAQTIEARRIEINARESSLSTLVGQAADMERSGKVVSDALKGMISGERVEIERQKQFLLRKEAEKDIARSEYERDVAKYNAAVARAKED
jgi:hypothetical protein